MSRYICIHGHFYQPPRENPWLETIEIQDSAHPYRDWNERITAECYAPNSASRILDQEKRIINIVNNYSQISFNFGPTLLSWMKDFQPETYEAILAADHESLKNFSGHGSALAQVYNHIIMPLANRRDKETQIIWGIKDFQSRFKRYPEGMWLAETAVDLETLELLAQHQIKFTILAPRQASRLRKIGDTKWVDVKEGQIDPKRPYYCHLPSGKKIALFFYDGPLAQDIAFGGLLNNGDAFANRILSVFPSEDKNAEAPLLSHVATDGETYGHHHFLGDMALAYCLNYIQSKHLAKVTIYAEFLEKFPPDHEVEIIGDSSWSCAHGVERWTSDCGCNSGGHPQWNQKWRGPLREALDWLRDKVSPLYEKEMSAFSSNPWQVRNEYIEVILNRKDENIDSFVRKMTNKDLSESEKIRVLKLLELQRHAQLMYTSCGWFFDEISGIETVQIIQYAARSIQLAKLLFNVDLEAEFKSKLSLAPSNVPDFKDGEGVFQRFVQPSIIDLYRVSANYSMTSLFLKQPNPVQVYSYHVENKIYELFEDDKRKLLVGSGNIQSVVTKANRKFSFAVFHEGDHNLHCSVRDFISPEKLKETEKKLKSSFEKENREEVLKIMSEEFDHHYTLTDLFRLEQEHVLNKILELSMKGIEKAFREIYEKNVDIIQGERGRSTSLPKVLATIVEYVLNRELAQELKNEDFNLEYLKRLTSEVKRWSFTVDKLTIGFLATQKLNKLMQKIYQEPDNILFMGVMDAAIQILNKLNLKLDLWRSQNLYYLVGKEHLAAKNKLVEQGDQEAGQWIKRYNELGSYLLIKGS